jgi:hypothetical protein
MRSARADPEIGVSCGHRVPRTPVAIAGLAGRRYWCESCGAYRMSGGTGEQAFDFLLELRDEISARGLEVDDPGTDQGRAIVEAFGATIRGCRDPG